jgi:hypothetical protein
MKEQLKISSPSRRLKSNVRKNKVHTILDRYTLEWAASYTPLPRYPARTEGSGAILYIQEVPGSILGHEAHYPDTIFIFPTQQAH